MEKNKILKIENCPICNEPHNYGLAVRRSHVIKMLTANDMQERPTPKKFTRYFICPSNQERFQATVTLFDSSSHKIESVNVIGIKDE